MNKIKAIVTISVFLYTYCNVKVNLTLEAQKGIIANERPIN
jgi:hypothetical protein